MSKAVHALSLALAAALLGCGPSAPSQAKSKPKSKSGPKVDPAPVQTFVVDPEFAALVPERELPPPTIDEQLAPPKPRGWLEAAEPELSGPRKLDEVRALVAKHSHELVGCYEAALPVMPELEGELGMRFTIKPSGAVVDVEAVDVETFGHERAAACMARGVGRWEWKPIPAGLTTVEYRFRFGSR